jgi:hypothetical protein
MAAVVLSYSRADHKLVYELVRLLRAAFQINEAVFWDNDIPPGDPWYDSLQVHIEAAGQLFVLWCGHSATSPQVRREYVFALERHIRTVPVLLDDTPLCADLAPLQGVDIRGMFHHERVSVTPGLAGGAMAEPSDMHFAYDYLLERDDLPDVQRRILDDLLISYIQTRITQVDREIANDDVRGVLVGTLTEMLLRARRGDRLTRSDLDAIAEAPRLASVADRFSPFASVWSSSTAATPPATAP